MVVAAAIVALALLTTGPTLAGFFQRAAIPTPGPYAYKFSIVLTTEKARPRDTNGFMMVKYPSGMNTTPVTVAQSALVNGIPHQVLHLLAEARDPFYDQVYKWSYRRTTNADWTPARPAPMLAQRERRATP